MAKKNQVTEARIASLEEKIQILRNENHNLKRKIKRMEERKATDKAKILKIQSEGNQRIKDVTSESIDEIKKNFWQGV